MPSIFATADIGSNTAHLLIAATDGKLVMRLENMNEWIPLGEEVAKHGIIPKERIEQLVEVMKDFRKAAVARSAESIYVFATEAMRSAKNHADVIRQIKRESGISVRLISPKREAELSVIGMRLDQFSNESKIMFEVGGGSAQIAAVSKEKIGEEISLPLGTGKLIAVSNLKFPTQVESIQSAREYIDQTLEDCPVFSSEGTAIACGGVARGLWRALHPDGEKELEYVELDYLCWATAKLSVPRIAERFNVKAKRAGTLLPGALIYTSLMKKFEIGKLFISEFGVREGAVVEMARGNVKEAKI